ncbi:MAG: serine/threonine protein kinase [Bryobacterales bacterium]|nr:serine/threonine protein kinase [Bryobacterales bacterium]
MDFELLQRAGQVYESALDLPESDREAFIRSQCLGDAQLEEQVLRLLEAASLEQAANQDALRQIAPPAADRRFGQYRVTGLLGQGGMGTVYKAERADGQFLRQAAVKVVTGTEATGELQVRFLTERQILAQLEHPHIARLLDGGMTEAGEPFLVMEYVDGEPIDQWCDARKLTIRERIELFLKVVRAVDFAHRQLIVHRDIKPPNVLVDQDGEPRLLDFGTAKILGPEQLGKTQQFLTPRYASPEQLRHQPASVSMDVYALGVLLYELLTGQWPFGDPHEANLNFARAMGQLRATIPSSTTSEAAASMRGVSARQMRELLRGDISYVLLRSLEADPKLRYASAREFADDLERYLGGYPVEARGKDAAYRFQRWISRNRWAAATAALVLISLGAGVFLREQQRRVAAQRETELRALSRYQLFELQDQMAFYGVAMPLRRAAAQRSLDALDRIPVDGGSSAEFRAELAESYARLAEILGNPMKSSLGRASDAKRALQRALDLAGTLPDGDAFLRTRLSVVLQQAMFEFAESKGTKPLDEARRLTAELRKRVRPDQDSPEDVARLAAVVGNLVQISRNAGGTILSESAGEEDLAVAEALLEAAIRRDPERPQFLQTKYALRLTQAETVASKRPSEGIAELLDIPARIDKHPPAIAAGRALRYVKAQALCAAGWFQGQARVYDDAITSLQAGAALLERIANDDPDQATAYFDLAGCYRTWGFVNEYAGRPEAAIEPLRKSIATHERILAKAPSEGTRMVRAELLIRLAKDLEKTGAHSEARLAGEQGLQGLIELASRPSATLNQLINAARYLMDPPPAVAKDPRRAQEFIKRAEAKAADNIFVLEMLSYAAEQNGDLSAALAAAKKRLALTPESNAPARELALKRIQELEAKAGTPAAQ